MEGWHGHDMDEITNLWGPPDEIIELGENRYEYKYYRHGVDPSCIHYWIVNDDNMIVGHRYEGRCRPIG
jgi:hypothetical protein